MLTHLLRQGPAIGATFKLLTAGKGSGLPELPGPEASETLPPRPRALVDDFIRVCGGDPKAWKGQLPPYMFPQWGWALLAGRLHGLPYDLTKVVNAGCAWTAHAPLPDDEPLQVAARLRQVDDDGRRVLIHLDLRTGTASAPDAVTSSLTAFCPLPRKKDADADAPREKRDKPTVPAEVQVIGEKALGSTHGWRFALVSGDPNPIHWLSPYARMAGFGRVILHGFCTAAIAAEAVIDTRFAGDVSRLRGIEARFTSPLKLPQTVQVYQGAALSGQGREDGAHELYVGKAPGGPAYLTGAFHG